YCADNPFGNEIAADNAPEYIDQHCLDVGVRQNDLERLADPFARGATTDIEEIGRLAAMQLDDVHCAHSQTSAVDHTPDVAIERHIVEVELRCMRFARIVLGGVV